MEISEAIQNLLFQYPLYSRCRQGDSVLVRGDDAWAAAFADQFLQVSQGMDLSLTWEISREETKQEYLKRRPSLCRFAAVEGCSEPADPCGRIRFCLRENWTGKAPYIFCSQGELPKAEGLMAQVQGRDITVNQAPDRQADWEDLLRMAFNTHLVWEDHGNIDYAGAEQRFSRSTYRQGSLSFALALPYKLWIVGIREKDPLAAARQLQQILTGEDPRGLQIRETLTVLEHNRWIMEMIAKGVTGFTDTAGHADYGDCLRARSVKVPAGESFRHPCLERSRPGQGLLSPDYASHSAWDRAGDRDRQLDDLDTMSLRLHRTMLRAADSLRQEPRALKQALWDLEDIFDRPHQKRCLDRYRFCIQNMLDRKLPYAPQFDSYERPLRQLLRELPPYLYSQAEALLDRIRDLLFPVLNLYRDYKQYDRDLTLRLPFILTGRFPIHLCLPLGSTENRDNNDYFKAVASATALYAGKVTYLYVPGPAEKPSHLLSKLKAIHSYFTLRGNPCTLELQVLADGSWGSKKTRLLQILQQARQEGYIHHFDLTPYDNEEDRLEKILEIIRTSGADYYDGTAPLIGSPSENGRLTAAIPIPYLEFDSYNRRFCHCRDCEALSYMPISSFLQVEDMFALMNAFDVTYNYQDYADSYLDYWSVYCGDAIGESDFPLCARSWSLISGVLKAGGSQCLSVRNRPLTGEDPRELHTAVAMLRALEGKGILRDLRIRDTGRGDQVLVSADLAGRKQKNIFSKAGDILEIYVYFEACRMEWFHDVQSGYHFQWEFDRVSNELDCVLTRGYRSLLVECKSTKKMEEGFYLTLDSLADHFGINYKKVLILVTDTREKNYPLFVSRGRQMDIITLSTREDLDNIGQRLKEIMEH